MMGQQNAGTDEGTVTKAAALCPSCQQKIQTVTNTSPIYYCIATHLFSLSMTKIHTKSTFLLFMRCRSDTLNFEYEYDTDRAIPLSRVIWLVVLSVQVV